MTVENHAAAWRDLTADLTAAQCRLLARWEAEGDTPDTLLWHARQLVSDRLWDTMEA